MNITKLLIVVLVFLTAAVAAQDAATMRKRITNQDIISMVQLGLSEDVIAAKIRATNAADPSSLNFDTSLEGLKALKAANVPDSLIHVMINPGAVQTTVITAAAPVTLDPNLPPPEVGVYWKDETRFVMIEGQALVRQKSAAKPDQCSLTASAVCTGTPT